MSPQLLRETKPTARKPHRCSMCHGRIEVGEEYCRSTLKHDDIYDWLECQACTDDTIANCVYRDAFYDDEVITAEDAYEWALATVVESDEADKAGEKYQVARRYLARAHDTTPDNLKDIL